MTNNDLLTCLASPQVKNEILNSNFVKVGGHMLLLLLCASSHLADDLGCLFVVLPCTELPELEFQVLLPSQSL